MEELIEGEKHFICFLANNTNFKQTKACIYEMDRHQLHCLREIAENIKHNIIQTGEENFAETHKSFLNRLIGNTLSWNVLEKNSGLLVDICRFALQHYALCNFSDSEEES